MIATWARVLSSNQNSRLLILSPTANELEADNEIRLLFARNGIPPERLDFAHRCPREEYLKLFNQIDIHLDTFPYNGCTTTCDGLYLGVPTITLAGNTYVSRNGLSLLTHVGLNDLIATTPEEYVRHATQLASNLDRLRTLRDSLRSRMKASPLMDAKTLARNIEAAYRSLWCQWCVSQS